MKRPDRFPQKSCVPRLISARGLRWIRVTVKPVRSGLAELLRGRMSDAGMWAEGLLDELLAQTIDDG